MQGFIFKEVLVSLINRLCFLLVFMAIPVQANANNIFDKIHTEYKIKVIGTLDISHTDKLIIERAYRFADNKNKIIPIERIQFRNEAGNIVARTPTRLSTILLCFKKDTCWVFMWKTVYPLPAIFKFNADQQAWISEKKSPMKYSRRGYAGEGFIEIVNPIFGVVGLILLYIKNIWYYGIIIIMSVLLSMQIVKFHDLSIEEKTWFKHIFLIINAINFTMLPIEPYMITAVLIYFLASIGDIWVGVPFTVGIGTIFITFFLSSIRLAKLKRDLS